MDRAGVGLSLACAAREPLPGLVRQLAIEGLLVAAAGQRDLREAVEGLVWRRSWTNEASKQ